MEIKINYRLHNSPQLVPIMNHMIQVQLQHDTRISLWCILILCFHLRLGLPSGLLLSYLPTKTIYVILFFPARITCRVFSSFMVTPSFHHPNNIWCGVELTKRLITQAPPVAYYRLPRRHKRLPQHPIVTFFSLRSSFVTYLVSHPFKTTGNIGVLNTKGVLFTNHWTNYFLLLH
jgi:hypothetical protein